MSRTVPSNDQVTRAACADSKGASRRTSRRPPPQGEGVDETWPHLLTSGSRRRRLFLFVEDNPLSHIDPCGICGPEPRTRVLRFGRGPETARAGRPHRAPRSAGPVSRALDEPSRARSSARATPPPSVPRDGGGARSSRGRRGTAGGAARASASTSMPKSRQKRSPARVSSSAAVARGEAAGASPGSRRPTRRARPPGGRSRRAPCASAGSRGLRLTRTAPVADGDAHQALEQLRDVAVGEPEVAVAALALDRHQPRFEELRQVRAHRSAWSRRRRPPARWRSAPGPPCSAVRIVGARLLADQRGDARRCSGPSFMVRS